MRVLQTLALPLGDDAGDFDFTDLAHVSFVSFASFARLAT